MIENNKMSVSSKEEYALVIVTGPIACGKRSLVSRYFCNKNIYTEIQPNHYSNRKMGGKTKSERILDDINVELSSSKNVVIINSGRFFVDEQQLLTCSQTITIIAPTDLVQFVNKWRVSPDRISMETFRESKFMAGIFHQIESVDPCKNAYLAMMNQMYEQMVESCDYRLRINFYKKNGTTITTPLGDFDDRETFLEEMNNLNKQNIHSQITLLMWARLNGHKVIPFTYDKSDYSVTCNF